jgi:hypothetical protein
MLRKNVLVFPCGSEIGLEINRALANSIHFNLFGASSLEDHGKFVFKNYISGLPFVDAPSFIEEINIIIVEYKIDFIIPAHDSVVLKMAINQDKIKAIIVTSCAKTNEICISKGKTYDFFCGLIPTPRIFNKDYELPFPVFLKPNIGNGSKGTYKAYSQNEVDFYLRKDPTLIILEYLPGKEYTVDCFTDRNGLLLFAEGRERRRIYNGISVNSVPNKNSQIQKIAQVINGNLAFQGVWFFQLKSRANGELVLLEVASRIAGTMALFRAMGINFILLSLYDRMGLTVSVTPNNFNLEIDRALYARYTLDLEYEYIYVDFDDTIIVNNLVNTNLIKFLYQSKNKGKKIFLISKHKGKIQEAFKNYALCKFLFDEIIILEQSMKKVEYIKNLNSIFIDDSYSERKEVLEDLKVPVFGLDAIESLFDDKV